MVCARIVEWLMICVIFYGELGGAWVGGGRAGLGSRRFVGRSERRKFAKRAKEVVLKTASPGSNDFTAPRLLVFRELDRRRLSAWSRDGARRAMGCVRTRTARAGGGKSVCGGAGVGEVHRRDAERGGGGILRWRRRLPGALHAGDGGE